MKIHLKNSVDSAKLAEIDSITFSEKNNPLPTKLMVVWSSADPDVANKVCFMYTDNAKRYNWFNTIRLIIWGPSAKLLSQNNGLKSSVRSMIQRGVIIEASKACTDAYNVTQTLQGLGVTIKDDMGKAMAGYIKSDYEILTF